MRVEPWNIVFLAGFVAYVTIRGRFARDTKDNVKTVRRVDAIEKILLVLVGIASLLLPVLYLLTPWLAFADYRLPAVRHPMYASILLWDLAQGLMLRNWLAGWSALATFALLYVVRVPREERMMRDAFGQDYRDYVRRTGRLVPPIVRGGI